MGGFNGKLSSLTPRGNENQQKLKRRTLQGKKKNIQDFSRKGGLAHE